MFKDQMTPKERMIAFSKGDPIDRIPIVPDMGVTMASFIGATTYEYYTSSEVLKDTEVALFKRLRHDSVGVSTTLRGMAEAMGSEIGYPPDNITFLKKPVVENPGDISKLKIIDPEKDGKLPVLLEALQKIRDEIGDEADIGASMTAPFSVCASVIGTDNLLRWIVKRPEAVHEVMEIITLCNEQYIKALGKIGFSTGFCDPVSSTSLIKKKHFDEFSLPYLKRNVEHVMRYCNSKPTIHICGGSKDLWRDIMEIGIGNFSIDNCEDLQDAKEIMGHKVCITGNVPPVDALLLGNKDDIDSAVRECVKKAWDSPCGFILSTGCQIPKGTKIENIEYFMEAGKKYGTNPIQTKLLEGDYNE